MNIIRKENENHLFCNVRGGGVFEYDHDIFMKFEETNCDGHVCNAICLEDGTITYFRNDEIIRFVDADLVIH